MRLWPRGGLWRHGDFLKLWSAETISVFGSQISGLALPLVAILTLEVSAFEVALLGVIEFLPFILVSLPAGVWVDRLRRRPILIAGDLARAVLLASIPIAYLADALTIWQLYVVGFAFGIFTVFFDVAYQSYLPSLVARDQLVEGNSKLEITRSASQIGGPGASGLLVQAVTAPGAVLIDAISFVASALFLFRIRTVETTPARGAQGERGLGMKAELAEGLRWVLGNRMLRSIAASTATFNFFGNLMFAVLLVYVVRELGMSAGVIGVVMMLGNIGFLLGALMAGRIAGWIGVGPAIVAGSALGAAQLLIPAAPQDANGAIPFLVVAFVISGFGVVLYNVNQLSLRQAITPERLQGRMNSVMRFIVWGVIPLGTLAGGTIASLTTLRTSVWVGAIGMCLAALPVLFSPVRSLRTVPEPDAPLQGAGEVPLGPGPTPVPVMESERS